MVSRAHRGSFLCGVSFNALAPCNTAAARLPEKQAEPIRRLEFAGFEIVADLPPGVTGIWIDEAAELDLDEMPW